MFNITQRLSWLSSLATAAFLGFTTLLSGCGGGGADSSAPLAMTVVPAAATAYAYSTEPTTLTIRNGKKPFHVVSDNTAIISFNPATMPNGTIADEYIVLSGPDSAYGRVNNVDADTTVTLTVFDADNQQVKVAVTVKPSALNETLLVNGTKATNISDGTYPTINNGENGTASVTAKTTTGAALPGHKIRFRAMDQGAAFSFVCNPSLGDCLIIETDSAGRVITVETTTDVNGNAYAVIKPDSTASSQAATIRATDTNTGQILTGQFLIVGDALSVLPASPWAVPDTLAAAVAPTVGVGCPAATRIVTIFGGFPPYTVYINDPLIATITGVTTSTTIAASGGSFTISALGGNNFVNPGPAGNPPAGCGTATFTIRDSSGTTSTYTVTNTAN